MIENGYGKIINIASLLALGRIYYSCLYSG